ncbi:GntR family transcriptional regulator [Noviherbaspirillum humi]|uniref:GntR family transcriptional regulator n=1 Tax=Noviherbaspirillum humi TaxID=1688639 RepID=A0A239BWQ6_9BURK|nr:GntR family transcriptional regulator [Noviherbaspirillum humi]SNS11871.1 GntR family transcriptional regulator [Noviherbaspirillum humi]
MQETATINRSRVPLYLQLATLFRNRIASGQWPVGERIPNLDDLVAEFAVARGTMREAMGELEREGLLERVRGRGSFVRSSPLRKPVHQLETDWAALIAAHQGQDVQIEVLEHGRTSVLPDFAAGEGVPVKQYEMMRRLHRRNGHPAMIGRSFLCSRLYRQVPKKRMYQESILTILHELLGPQIAQARQVLTIDTADMEIASHLDLPLNAPVARVQRLVLDHGGHLIYAGEGLYRGDMVRLEINLR